MADTFITAVNEENDRSKRAALYNLAAQALAPQQQEVSAEQIDQINRIGAVSTKSISETAHSSSNDGKKISAKDDLALLQTSKTSRQPPKATLVSQNEHLFPELAKVMNAATSTPILPGASSERTRELHTVFSNRPAPTPPLDPQAANRVMNEAVKYLQRVEDRALRGNLSVDQMADAINVPIDEIAEYALSEAADKLSKKEGGALYNYPNVAREMLNLGLKMESFKTEELERHKKRGDEYREKIQSLLKFSALLDKLPSDKDSHDLKELFFNQAPDPEKPLPERSMDNEEIEQCIKEVFPGGSYIISKEQLSGGKVRTNDIMGEYKTKMTNLLTTEISIVIHNLQMMTQMMQEIAKKHHQLVSSVVSHYGGR